MVIDAESRLGELLNKIESKEPIRNTDGSFKGTIGKLPVGIDKKESHYAQFCTLMS